MAATEKCRRCGAAIEPDALRCPYCGHRLNDEWKAEIRARRQLRRRRRLIALAVSAVVLTILIVAAWPRDAGKEGDGSISAANSYIAKVIPDGTVLRVTADLPAPIKPADAVAKMGGVIHDVGRAIAGGADDVPKAARTILFEGTWPSVDRKGNQIRITTFRLSFDLPALQAANYKNVGPIQILNMATRVQAIGPGAAGAVRAFCAPAAYRAAAAGFCARSVATR